MHVFRLSRMLLAIALLVLAGFLVTSCSSTDTRSLGQAIEKVNADAEKLGPALTQLQNDLNAWSGSSNVTVAAATIRKAAVNNADAIAIERRQLAILREAGKLKLDEKNRAYITSAASAYESHILALESLNKRLVTLTDLYSVIEGIAAAENSTNNALSASSAGKPKNASASINAAAVKLRSAQEALRRSASQIQVPGAQAAVSQHQQLNGSLKSAADSGNARRLHSAASGELAEKASLATERVVNRASRRAAQLGSGVASVNGLFNHSTGLFIEMQSQFKAIKKT